MLDLIARLDHFARLLTEEVERRLCAHPPLARVAHVVVALDALAPRLGERFLRLRRGRSMTDALACVLGEHMADAIASMAVDIDLPPIRGGLGAVAAPLAPPVERDDVALHNDVSTKSREWQEAAYRGLWLPGHQVAIKDLTTHDVALATAYLGGKLTQRGCPKSDKTRSAEKWNLAYKIVHGIESVAGAIAGIVLTAIYGPIAGVAVKYLHQAKMALMDRFWKMKVARDPAFRALVKKLQPQGWMSYRGFRFQVRPYGNMLVMELGCRRDLGSRSRLHGRMLRTIDVLASSAPTARSRPGGYDYVSAFGPLKGSIFPPRGPVHDGVPAPPRVAAQVTKAIASAPIQALLNQPATAAHAALPVPSGLLESAKLLQAQVEMRANAPTSTPAAAAATPATSTNKAEHLAARKPTAGTTPWLLVLGGAALGAAILATR